MNLRSRKISIILGIMVVLVVVGTVGALNGWWGGGGSIPEDTFTRGLAGYWSFDEGAGLIVYDESENGNNGTINGAGGSSDWLSGWDQRVRIRIDYNDIDSNLSNFPVLIYLSDSSGPNNDDVSFVFDELQSDGNSKKIAVTESDGTTELYVEIEKWDDASETAWLWVSKSDWTILSGSYTDIYLYYDADHADNDTYVGDATIGDRGGPRENVWDDDFIGVWHLSESSGTRYDSTSYDNDGALQGVPIFTSDAQIGAGVYIDGVGDGFEVASMTKSATALTVETWVQPNSTDGGGFERWLCFGPAWNDSEWVLYARYGQLDASIHFGINNGTVADYLRAGNITRDDAWHYITATFDAGDIIIYQDDLGNVGNVTAGSSSMGQADTELGLGNENDQGSDTEAFFDEMRISKTPRNAAWVNATYETEIDDLLDFGSEEIESGGVTTWTTGKIGSAYDFDGTNDYVSLEAGADALDITGDISASLWFYPDDLDSILIDNRYNFSGNEYGYHLQTEADGTVLWSSHDGATNANAACVAHSTGTITANQWNHIVVTKAGDSTTVNFYINGQPAGTDTVAATGIAYSGSYTTRYIGTARDSYTYSGTYEFGSKQYTDGKIEEVRVYNRALSEAEIRFHYSRGGPMGYWKFDDGSGQRAYDSTWDNDRWFDDWNYRKSHVIESTNNSGPNYQMKIIAHYGTSTDSGEDVYLSGNSRTDFGDVRFTGNDGITELDYWQESVESSDFSIFWVEVTDDFSNSDTTIYIYYGNSSETTTSNGDNTFLFFDDFLGSSLDPQWDDTDGTPLVTGGWIVMYLGDEIRDSTPSWLYDVRLHTRVVSEATDQSVARWGLSNSATTTTFYNDSCAYENHTGININTVVRNNGSSMGEDAVSSGYGAGVPYISQMKWKSGSIEFWFDSDTTTQTTYVPTEALNPRMEGNDVDDYVAFDWIFVAKWVDSEPTHSIWTEEEESTGWLGGSSAVESSDPTWVKGKFGMALNFDGDNDYVDLGENIIVENTDLTLSAWVYLEDLTVDEKTIISKYDSSGNSEKSFLLRVDDVSGIIEFFTHDGSLQKWKRTAWNTISTNMWYHVVVVYDESENDAHIYVNGELKPNSEADDVLSKIQDTDTPITIGTWFTGNDPFEGSIDEVRIYNYARTHNEIRLDYNAGFATRFGPHTSCDDDPGACMTNGLVGYWAMDEGAGTTAEDASEEGNDGILNGADWTTGKVGGALEFDGVSDYVISGDIDLINNFTISAWIKPYVLNDSYMRIVHKNGAYTFWINDANSSLGGYFYQEPSGGDYYWANTNTLTADEWHHVVMVKSSVDGFSIYVNGKDEGGSSGFTGDVRENDVNVYIGIDEDETTYDFDGKIDEVRIYSRVLSATEIRYHYNRGEPVGYWKFDEGSGTLVGDTTDNMNNAIIHGPSLDLDGTNDYVVIPSAPDLTTAEGFTIEFWFKPGEDYTTKANGWYGGVGSSSWYRGFFLGWNGWSDSWSFGVETSGEQNNRGYLPGGTYYSGYWYHILVTYKNGNAKIWEDGEYLGDLDLTFSQDATDYNLNFGNVYRGGFLNGLINNVRLYDRDLSNQEAQEHFRGVFKNESNLVGYWPIGEGSGDVAYDHSVNLDHGNLGGDDNCPAYTGSDDCPDWVSREGPTWTTGRLANALNFDGNDFLEVFESDGLDFTGEFSFSTWFKLENNAVNYQTIFSKGSGNTTTYWADIRSPSQSIIFGGYNSGAGIAYTTYATGGLVEDRWYHLSGTYDKLKLRIYLGGQLVHSASETDDWVNNNDSLALGSRGLSSNYFYGSIDDLKIYNYVRSDEEIRIDYNAGFAARFGPHSDCDKDPGACMTNGLVGYWNFNEGAGTKVEDQSGEGNDGTFVSNPVWVQGKKNMGLEFDGIADRISVNHNSSLAIEDAITIEAWINPDSSGNNRAIVRKVTSTDGFEFRLYGANPNLYFLVRESNGTLDAVTGTLTIGIDVWTHVAAVFDGTKLYLYVNGEEDNSDTSSSGLKATNTTSLGIFRNSYWATSEYYSGLGDELRIYNRALSATEIRYHYNKGGPVGYWKFNEGEGQIVYDNTDNNNDGTLGATSGSENSDPTWVEGKYGGALSFDGSDDYVNVGNDSSLDITKVITIGAWIKGNYTVAYDGIVTKYAGTTDQFQYLIQSEANTGKIQLTYKHVSNSNDWTMTDESYADGQWHYIVGIINTIEGKEYIYVDGALRKTKVTTAGEPMISNDSDLLIGVREDQMTQVFQGLIDDVRIYNYARTPAQILQDYNAGFSIHFK